MFTFSSKIGKLLNSKFVSENLTMRILSSCPECVRTAVVLTVSQEEPGYGAGRRVGFEGAPRSNNTAAFCLLFQP